MVTTETNTTSEPKKEKVAPKARPTVRKPKTKNPVVLFLKSVVAFFRNEKVKLLFSLIFFIFSLLLLLAFTSYLFTWKNDHSKLDLPFYDFISNPEIIVNNWAGKIGASLAYTFIHKWFGVSSFGFIFLILIYCFKLIKIELLPFFTSLKITLSAMLWCSVALSFLFGDKFFLLGGAHGYFINSWLSSFMGGFGTALILLLTLFLFFLFGVDNSLEYIKNLSNRLLSTKVFQTEPIMKDENTEATASKPSNKTEKPKTEISKKLFSFLNTKDDDFEDEDDTLQNKDKETVNQSDATEKREFILGKDGTKRDLGFEVENTTNGIANSQNESNSETSAKKNNLLMDKYLKGGIEVENSTAEDVDDDEEEVKTTLSPNDLLVGDLQVINKIIPEGELVLRVEHNQDIQVDEINLHELGEYDPTKDLSSYKFPPLELLEDHKAGDSEVTNEELISNKEKIEETLKNFKIAITKIKATIGPTITLYEIIPAPGIRISKIKNLEDDIALSLSALGIRIIAPMPGRGTIGIEVPNRKPEIVSMRSVISSKRFQETKYELPIALGKTISNETYVADLAKMPHLLVAGATGQGKSVGLNAIITSLLYKKHPSQLKFVLVDPKKVELNLYEKLERHFLAKLPDAEEAIITDNQKVVHTLSSLNVEMDSRYELLKKAQVRTIKEYNVKFIARRLNPQNGHGYMPYLVLVIDEFADLIMTAGKEVELPIARMAQLARAVGIHLIVATQRPSTNIITGVIKANFPTRIAFKVASMIDSRTILDSPGANQLIGRGDMLITQGSDLIRLQCAFLDTPEVEKIADYIGNQRGYPTAHLLPEYEGAEISEEVSDVDLSKRDELFEDAARIVVMSQQGSTSLIQRKLSIGYNRAGRIIDQLEAAGIVGPFEGSKARQVLYPDEYSLERYLNALQ